MAVSLHSQPPYYSEDERVLLLVAAEHNPVGVLLVLWYCGLPLLRVGINHPLAKVYSHFPTAGDVGFSWLLPRYFDSSYCNP